MVEGELVYTSVLVGQLAGEGDTRREVRQSDDGNLVTWLDLLVVGWVCEDQGQHSLFLQVRLVDTSEAAHDDGFTSEVTGLERGVLPRASFSVVFVSDNNPSDTLNTGLLEALITKFRNNLLHVTQYHVTIKYVPAALYSLAVPGTGPNSPLTTFLMLFIAPFSELVAV